MNYEMALKKLNLIGFKLETEEDYARIMDIWRDATVKAREVKNDVLAADLSQVKEAIKGKWDTYKECTCPRCNKQKSPKTDYCADCLRTLKGDKHFLVNGGPAMYEVRDDVFVTMAAHGDSGRGELTEAMRKLIQVGDSFLTNKSPTSVKNVSKNVGIETICRKQNPGEKNKTKLRYRVWRSDGLSATDVNRAIKQRVDSASHISHDNGEPISVDQSGGE